MNGETRREKIVARLTGASAPISASKLAEELGVSRSPVHQAIDQLITDGLVMRDTGKSCVVVSLSRQEYIDLYNSLL